LNPSWNNSTTPPGIDATYRIYKEFGSDIIKKLNLGILDSTSVGIRFLWKKSHPGMRLWDFLDNLGREIDGQIVRFVITKILSVPEASIVYAGADENAKRLSQTGNQNLNDIINSQGDNMDEIMKLEKQLTEKTSELTELRTKHTALETENKTLKTENEKLKPLAALGEAQHKTLREDAEKFYRLAEKTPKDEMVKILQSGDLETVKTLHADFKERAEKLHPAKCPNCQVSLTRQSSKTEGDTSDETSDDDINMDDYEI
jgi:regulator of replication initiation timing